MGKEKRKINAVGFVDDVRSGMVAQELMNRHGLNESGLKVILRKLAERGLLEPADIREVLESRIRFDGDSVSFEDTSTAVLGTTEGSIFGKSIPLDESICPQCGAEVSSRALTCPECGHVLPGSERWDEVDRKKGIFERVPPLVLGCLLALPAAIGMFYVFKNIILPMTEAKVEQAEKARAAKKSSAAKRAGPASGTQAARAGLREELERLIADDILAGADKAQGVLTAGGGWTDLTGDDAEDILLNVRRLMTDSGYRKNLKVIDLWGNTVATVEGNTVDLVEEPEAEEVSTPKPARKPPSPKPKKKAPTEKKVKRKPPPKKKPVPEQPREETRE